MSNLTKLEFNALDVIDKNYLTWILDVEIHLNVMGLSDTIKENKISEQDKAKTMIFLRHHPDEGLKTEYLTIKDPSTLWKNLKERYDHQKMVILPKARYDWLHLRLQDYKSVSEYNSAMFKITSQLKLCGENITDKDMLEKTYSTFHANNMLAVTNNEYGDKNTIGRGRGYGCGRTRGRNFGHGRGHNHQNFTNFKRKPHHQKWTKKEEKPEGNTMMKRVESVCSHCEMKGHWRRTCRTFKHFADLYQAFLKNAKTNFVEQNDPLGIAHLEAHLGGADPIDPSGLTHMKVGDFFEDENDEMAKFDGGNNKAIY